MLLRDWAWIKRVSILNSSPVPKTGQILKESSIYQMVIKKRMGLVCIDKMTIVALKVPSYKANERGVWHPESKNRSTVKARFRHPKVVWPICNTFHRPIQVFGDVSLFHRGYLCYGTAHSYEKKLRQKARWYRLRL